MIKPKQAGFTLIEIVITLLIIGVAILLYQAGLNSILLTRNAKDQEIALRIANNEIESLRAGGYSNVPPSGAFSDSMLSTLQNSSAGLATSDFNAKTKQVTATVSWTEPGANTAHSIQVSTLITQVGGLK